MKKVVVFIIVLIFFVTIQSVLCQKWISVGNESFTPKFISYPSIALDKNSVPYVAYCDSNYIGTTVKKYNGTNWVTLGDRGFSGERPSSSSISIDNNGIPYVLYLDGDRYATVQKFNGSNWEVIGNKSMSYGISLTPSLAIDKKNTPYVAYYGQVPGTYNSKTTVKKFNGTNWELVGPEGFTYSHVYSIAFDNKDVPYVLCQKDSSTTDILTVMKYYNSNWELVTRFSSNEISNPTMTINNSGIIYIVYLEDGYNIIKFNGSGWTKILNNLITANLSMSIDKNGLPSILFHLENSVVMQKYEDNNWKAIGNPISLFGGSGSAYPCLELAISEQNTPYVAFYQYNGRITVKKFDVDTIKTDTIRIPSTSCKTKCDIISNTNWIVSVDKSWLSVNPATGSGNGSFILAAQENLSKSIRSAIVKIISTDGTITKITQVFQDSIIHNVNANTPGSLLDSFNQVDKTTITSLRIIGTIDARDFKFIRDSLSMLAILDLSGANVAAYEGTEGTYSSASTTYNAMTIPQRAFYNYNTGKGKTTLATVILPTNLTSIGAVAFYGCNGLITINIPPSVTTISKSAFYGCSELTSLDLPSSLTNIGDYAFDNCSKISSIKLPDGLISIGNYAFENCSSLIGTLCIPNSVSSLGNYAFNNCSALNGNLFLSESLSNIGQGVFYNCTNFSGNLSIPSSVTAIGKYAFYNCKGFTGSISIPDAVTTIGEFAFWNCHSLSGDLKLPTTLLTIENSTFNECGNITSVTIPSTVRSIGNYAFMACDSLKSISIPLSVQTIGNQSFSGSKKLSAVYVFSASPIDISISSAVFYNSNTNNCSLYVPVGSKTAYQNANKWKDFGNIIEMTTSIQPILQSDIKLRTENGKLNIEHVKEGSKVEIYNVLGKKIIEQTIMSNQTKIPLLKGIYLIRINNYSDKVIIK